MIGVLLRLDPSSVLDIGVGFGKWGHLIREYTDIRLAERDPDRYSRENWKTRIDGIEGFPGYLTAMHDYLYDRIHVGDMREIIRQLGRYDMILLADVIEHVEKADGEALLQDCLAHCDGAVVVSTPAVFRPQGDACGNPFEAHRSFWRA
ncbi:MAG: class I SAM-dependent methyltransferase, partial [Gemmatimonadota bacterium]